MWPIITKSILLIWWDSICVLKSGVVSIKMFFEWRLFIRILVRNLLFFRLFDLQVGQLHPIIGIPVLVPEPSINISLVFIVIKVLFKLCPFDIITFLLFVCKV